MMAGEQFMTVNYIRTQTNLCAAILDLSSCLKSRHVAFGCKVKMKQLSSVIQRSHLRFIKKSRCPRMTVNMQEPFRQMGAEHLLCGGPFICMVPDQAAYDRFCMRRHLVDVSVEYKQ